MALSYQADGALVPGVHEISWAEFVQEYGYNHHRQLLIEGLKQALSDLKIVGCKKVYVDGSFVTKKLLPNDYDACWEHDGVDIARLKHDFPLFFDFTNKRAKQKDHYKGELMPARIPAKLNPVVLYINFFQKDKDDNPKGIICLSLN